MKFWQFLYLLKLYVFWLLVFATERLIFILYNFGKISGEPLQEILLAFVHAVYLDTSAIAYILALPVILLILRSFINWNGFLKMAFGWQMLFVFVSAIITASDLPLYHEWGTKTNYKALKYLSNPSEVWNTATLSDILAGFILIAAITFGAYYFYKKYIPLKLPTSKQYLPAVLFTLLAPVLIVLGLRGGWQEIAIQQSVVYYSKNNTLNTAAVNSLWNLGHSIDQNRDYLNHNPYMFMPLAESKQIVDSLYYIPKDTTEFYFLKEDIQKPNIVYIILESWSADLIKVLGGYDSLTPNFNKLSESGILFTRTFASGERSDQGMAAIFSAFPAQPMTSIATQPDKYNELPSIVKIFKENGYYTSFFFGGDLSYGNIKSYMYFNGFDKILEEKDFDDSIPRGGLGVHDQYLFDRNIRELKQFKEPFFSANFTLSTHSPFDMPMETKFTWGGDEQRYINSGYYTDKCIGQYFEKAKKQPWYKNTLFVIVADHSHNSPRQWGYFHPMSKKIPLLFYGEVIKEEYRGKKINKVCSQIDLASTLLHQLHLPDTAFNWSKNILNPYTQQFAYSAFVDGLVWVRPDSNMFAYSYNLNRFFNIHISNSKDSAKIIKEGQAYLETVFQEYLEK
jgi:phosphoglycerol transferase MdoB-like AlkP superfamily enzyme